MGPGDIVGGRFLIESLAGSGGMADVFRATDVSLGGACALKVIRGSGWVQERFDRETAVLASISDPSVVRYVAHGLEAGLTPWIAMEWIEGRDLESRLRTEGLTIDESLALVRKLSEALVALHRRGIVHRDLKPGNVMLRGGDPRVPVLLDFGIARAGGDGARITATGTLLGTAGYMAPEQASGGAVDARADVFALGCILFECLTGRPAYSGEGPLATLAKLLLEDPPRVRSVRPSVSVELDEACARMMERDAAARPRDAAAVLVGLTRDVDSSMAPPAASRPSALSLGERRVHTIVLGQLERPPASGDRTLSTDELFAPFAALREAARDHGGRLIPISSEVVSLVLESGSAGTDPVAVAADAALAFASTEPGAAVAIATGRADTSNHRMMGPVIDRATRILAAATQSGRGRVLVDESTRDLLGEGFCVVAEGGNFVLSGESALGKPASRAVLLGRASPFLGRERELSTLLSFVRECESEEVSRVVVVTGPLGAGKSRLRDELEHRLAEGEPRARVLSLRGEYLRSRSPLHFIRSLVRESLSPTEGLVSDETLVGALDQLDLEEDVARGCRVLAGLSQPEDEGPLLQAALHDPAAMRHVKRRAFEGLMDASTRGRPLILLFDNVQWIDPASLALITSTVRRLAERPLAVALFARPDVADAHPSLASDAGAHEIKLLGLSRRTAERLVKEALGAPDPSVTARIVDLADGNPFFLEELVRKVALARSLGPVGDPLADLPDTILASIEGRLRSLDPEARRVLRAASVVGERFTAEAAAAITGEDEARAIVRLAELVKAELVVVDEERHGTFAFRHALVQSAALQTLAPQDRVAAHAAHAEYLENKGERDASLIADHFVRGEQPERAIPYLLRAARDGLDGGSVALTLAHVERGISVGASGRDLGHLLAYRAYASGLQGNFEDGGRDANAALGLLERGTIPWFRCAATLVFSEVTQGKVESSLAVMRDVLSLEIRPEPTAPFGRTVTVLLSAIALFGMHDIVDQLLAALDSASEGAEEKTFTLWKNASRAMAAHVVRGHLAEALTFVEASRELLRDVPDPMALVLAKAMFARVLGDVGRTDEGLVELASAREVAIRWGAAYLRDWADFLTCALYGQASRHLEIDVERLNPLLEHRNPMIAVLALVTRGNIAAARGDYESAERDAIEGERALGIPLVVAVSSTVRARVAFARGLWADALRYADLGLGNLRTEGGLMRDAGSMKAIRIRALAELGRIDEAREAARAGRERIEWLARGLREEDRRTFLTCPAQVEVLESCSHVDGLVG